jgi:ubiquinone/menaquinone biosynthesis C-methylase UbiE
MNTIERQASAGQQRTEERGRSKLKAVFRKGGAYYGTVYVSRWVIQRVAEFLDRRLISVEQRKALVDPWTILSRRLTAAENRKIWNEYDWSNHGDEWTRSEEWKAELIRKFIDPYFSAGDVIVEIGPGGGRWSEILQARARKLYLIDVAEKPLELCRERFAGCSNIDYFLCDGHTLPVPDGCADRIWSYECFVHINPLDIKGYFHEFRRVLEPGGRALIHHAGPHIPGMPYRPGMRSDMTDKMALDFARECGLEVEAQTQELVNPRDVMTILRRPV